MRCRLELSMEVCTMLSDLICQLASGVPQLARYLGKYALHGNAVSGRLSLGSKAIALGSNQAAFAVFLLGL